MITIKHSHKDFLQADSAAYAVLLPQDTVTTDEAVAALGNQFFPSLQALFEERRFVGKTGSSVVIPISSKSKTIRHLIFIGLGKEEPSGTFAVEQLRRALARVVRIAKSHKIAEVAVQMLPAPQFGISEQDNAREATIAMYMADYSFDDFKNKAADEMPPSVTITLYGGYQDTKAFQEGVHVGTIIAHGVNQARHWVDMPPSQLTPVHLSTKAREIADKQGLSCKIFNEHEIKQMGMGGLAGVSAGSHQDCQLVILEYKTSRANAPTLAFVGKGITFDSGGLSIKPANAMETMKDDMAGAAAVINTMQIIAQLKPDVNIIALAPLAENLPSGTATKPGDILRFYNGKTAEVRNTDAEGRLILADALSYAVKHYQPDAIVDLATLTGACSYALGPFFAGLMSAHDELVDKIERAAHDSGDRVWRLPLDADYAVAVKSDVADLCNIGNQKYRAGAITAAFFLKSFVDEVPWAHVDIAGPAYDVPDMPYYGSGATGFGVRLLTYLAMEYTP